MLLKPAGSSGSVRVRIPPRAPSRRAAALIAAGFTLWPTEVFNDDSHDPRNDVHYDLLVATGPGLIPPD